MMKAMTAILVLCGTTAFAGEPFALKGDAAKGAESYKLFCVSCHGEGGAGDGAAAAALNPKPANLAVRAKEVDDKYLYEVIKDGGASKGKSPLMVSWKAAMDDQKLRDVTAFVRSLATKGAAKTAQAK